MSVPSLTIEEFAARIRGDRGFSSDRDRSDVIRKSELVAAAAYDYCRTVGYSGIGREHHERCCANYVAAVVGLPPRAVGFPPFVVALFWGAASKLLVELIWKAAAMIAEHLSRGAGAPE